MSRLEKLKQKLEKYSQMSPSEMRPLSVAESRVVAGITLGSAYEDYVSSRLYKECSRLLYKQPWSREALTPLPFISIPTDDEAVDKVNKILNLVLNSQGELRIVAAEGCVEHGLHGDPDVYMDFGSIGLVVCSMIRGCILLPKNSSWVNQSLMELLQLQCSDSVRVGTETFYRLSGTI
ncbi:hypothetical protein [Baaleninema simplex]|uniref:hypothetical protein n=1 Tax=Baaleninema simplex TaxID=2862350 RepID=UPI0011819C72|nr:hypothetical protein [Baaleninema simplex]